MVQNKATRLTITVESAPANISSFDLSIGYLDIFNSLLQQMSINDAEIKFHQDYCDDNSYMYDLVRIDFTYINSIPFVFV